MHSSKKKPSRQSSPLIRSQGPEKNIQEEEESKQLEQTNINNTHEKSKPQEITSQDSSSSSSSKKQTKFRIYGLRAALTAFEKRRESIQRVWISSSLIKIEPKIQKLLSYLAKHKKPYHLVEDNKELCAVSGSIHHEGIVLQTDPLQLLTPNEALEKIIQECEEKGEDTKMTILFLENVGNPHNLGSITRTAAFFGIPYLFVSTFDTNSLFQQKDSEQNTSRKTIVNPSMIRISVGGVFHVNVVHVQTYKELNSIFSTLKSKGFQVIVTSPTAPTRMSILHNEAQTKLKHNRNLIIFGAEKTGVTRRLIRKADFVVGMPPSGAIDTLNVGTAVAAFLSAVHILQNSTGNSLQSCQKSTENKPLEEKIQTVK